MTNDMHLSITHKLISLLDTVDSKNYQPPFSQLAASGLPFNPCTDKAYCGVNVLILWMESLQRGFISNEWGTFKQWKDRNCQVKSGEKSTRVVFYKRIIKSDTLRKTDVPGSYTVFKTYRVFNADQVDNYCADNHLSKDLISKNNEIESFVDSSGAVIEHRGSVACYHHLIDKIQMPHKSLFNTNEYTLVDNYYSTVLHELTLWTGGRKRFDRRLKHVNLLSGGQEQYAFEELVAELGCAFLCARFQIMQSGMAGHAIYLRSWLHALKENKKYLFLAAAQAQKAVDYLNDLAGRHN